MVKPALARDDGRRHGRRRLCAADATRGTAAQCWICLGEEADEHGGVLLAVRDALRAGVDVPSAYLRKRDDKDPSGGMRFHDVAAQLLQLLSQLADYMPSRQPSQLQRSRLP